MVFETNVFINCPFDKQYSPLLRAMSFVFLYLDFEPKLSQTTSSHNIRVGEIIKLIKNCKFSIHDLSRSRALSENDLPRFNMPYELGLDMGAFAYGNKKMKSKKSLVLSNQSYHYQQILSDMAGQDIANHNDDPKTLALKIRNWISINSPEKMIPSQTEIWFAFNQFSVDLLGSLSLTYSNEEIQEMPIGDYIKFSKDWLLNFKVES